jgi:hypothetical protein
VAPIRQVASEACARRGTRAGERSEARSVRGSGASDTTERARRSEPRTRRRACGSSDVEQFASARQRGASAVGAREGARPGGSGCGQPRARARRPLAEILTTAVAYH